MAKKRNDDEAKRAIAQAKKHVKQTGKQQTKFQLAYQRRNARAKAEGYRSYAEKRAHKAIKKGKTAQQARGHHPREKRAEKVRPGSYGYKYGAGKPARSQVVKRYKTTASGKRVLYSTSQRYYNLSRLTPHLIDLTIKKIIRHMRRLRKTYPRVQWRMVVRVQPYEDDPDDDGIRSTRWITVLQAFDRAEDEMRVGLQLYFGRGAPEAVLEPIAIYLDTV